MRGETEQSIYVQVLINSGARGYVRNATAAETLAEDVARDYCLRKEVQISEIEVCRQDSVFITDNHLEYDQIEEDIRARFVERA